MPAVLNASPLVHLTRLIKLGPTLMLYDRLYVPPAVYAEVVGAGKREGYPDAFIVEKMQASGDVRVERLGTAGQRVARKLEETLSEGEAEAIALAHERKLTLLMDDEHGRRIARLYDVDALTTLGAILKLGLARLISPRESRANIRKYAASGWISADVVERFLEELRTHE